MNFCVVVLSIVVLFLIFLLYSNVLKQKSVFDAVTDHLDSRIDVLFRENKHLRNNCLSVEKSYAALREDFLKHKSAVTDAFISKNLDRKIQELTDQKFLIVEKNGRCIKANMDSILEIVNQVGMLQDDFVKFKSERSN